MTFGYIFTFCDIGLCYIFSPLKLVLKTENSSPRIFWRIAGMVLLSGHFLSCTLLLRELRQRFFELDLEHCTLTKNPLRRFILFHWYCNFNPPRRSNDVWYLWNAWYLAKMSSFNLFFVWKIWHFLTLFRMGGRHKGPPTSFSPVFSTNKGISPQIFLTFTFNPFAILV